MKKVLALLALAVIFTVPAHAQDEAPGSQVQINGAILSTGFACGHASYPLYCYGIPLDNGGTVWLDSYYNSTTAEGFLQFNNAGDLGYAQITGTAAYRNGNGQIIQADYNFTGSTTDGDGGAYTGTATFTFSYYQAPNRAWIRRVQSATLTITYN